MNEAASIDESPRKSVLRRVLQIVAAVVVVGGLWFVARGVDGAGLMHALGGASIGLLVVVALLNFVNIAWKSAYWHAMVSPVADVPYGAMFRYTVVSITGSALFPARAGDFLRVFLLSRERRVPLRYAGSIAAFEKGGDVLALLIVSAPIPWLLHDMPSWVARSMQTVGAIAAAVVVVACVAWLSPKIRTALKFPEVSHPHRLAARAVGAIVLSWMTDLLMIILTMVALGLPASWGTAALVLLAINVAIAIPVAPGHAGTLELGAIAALDILGASRDRAVAFALLYHALQLIPTIALGLFLGRNLIFSLRTRESAQA